MRDRDQILLEAAYGLICEAPVVDPNPRRLIGQKVEVHPALTGSPEDPRWFSWSIKVPVREDGKIKKKVVHSAFTLRMENCEADIDHKAVAAFQLNPENGRKTPNLLVKGTIVDLDFDYNKIPTILSEEGWQSVTYNPHKHSEYVYKDKLPEWWNTDERFPHVQSKVDTKVRLSAKEERSKENFEYNELSRRISENISHFKAREMLFKRYAVRGEDYVWVKGVHY